MSRPIFSFVIPIYNEQETIPELYSRMCDLLARLDGSSEVVLIDDGSRDASYPMIVALTEKDPRFRVIHLSRNFGHQIAISAGIDLTVGDAVIIMDADLQDPPEVVLQMIEKWREGYEVVWGQRNTREGETWFKKLTATVFYRLMKQATDIDLPLDVGDFRLVDRKVVDAFCSLREQNRYVRGMFSWVGFKQTGIKYDRAARFAGTTKYPLRKMIRFAKDGLLSFSALPLRLTLSMGFVISLLALAWGIWIIVQKLTGGSATSGWTSLAALVTFLGGIQLMILGIMGEYIGRIYEEAKNRPLYVVKNLHGFETDKILHNGRAVLPRITTN